jgi:Transposase, Mutator family
MTPYRSGPGRPLLDRTLRTLPALRAGAGGDAGRDVRAGRLDRKVKAITEELCGHAFSASAISAINKRLDESLEAFAARALEEPFAYLILVARYEKVREGGVVMSQAVLIAIGVVMSQAVLIAIGVDWDGRARSSPSKWPIARAVRPGRTSTKSLKG